MFENYNKLSAFHQGQILTEGLLLVREDICDWFVTLFQEEVITGDTFLTSFQTGVLLCDLVEKIYQHISPTRLPVNWPKKPPKADRKATHLSFKARDNVSIFLAWCRSAGLRNTILFETKGLMNNDEEKNIVLTLLHLGEICVDFDIPVPQFARFKKEIDIAQSTCGRNNSISTLTDHSDIGSVDSGFNSARSTTNIDLVDSNYKACITPTRPLSSKSNQDKIFNTMNRFNKQPQKTNQRHNIRALKGVPPKVTPLRKTRSKSINDITVTLKGSADTTDKTDAASKIDIKVREISKRCCCETKFKIERTKMQEGMYMIGNKNIFVRMFKENVMLRIGGGWETLNEYLEKVDPCTKELRRRKSTSNLLDKSMTAERISSRDLRKCSQSELLKVKITNPSPRSK